MQILIVDDHPVLRDGIASQIRGEKDMVLVGAANNGRQAVERIALKRGIIDV